MNGKNHNSEHRRRLNVRAIQPVHCHNWGISHTCLSLCSELQAEDFDVQLWVPSVDRQVKAALIRPVVSPSMLPLVARVPFLERRVMPRLFAKYLRELRPGDIAYLWPGVPLSAYSAVKERGAGIVVERINCHQATARRILDAEFSRLGQPSTHGIDEKQIAGEQAELELADRVFAPSPAVEQSLIDNGVPASKVLRASYGWEPRRFAGNRRALAASPGVTVLFVGRVCIRKGAHLLLDYWDRAGIEGRLVMKGELIPEVDAVAGRVLKRADVHHQGAEFGGDIGALYRSADFFAFPTLEEGSPLVVYEALACGLPVLVSPMGAGDVVRDGIEGLVRDPLDAEAWISGLRQLSEDRALRERMGAASRVRAAEYTWQKVGTHRRLALAAAFRG